MSLTHSVAHILRERVTLTVESIDRLYLNVYVPKLQRVLGVLGVVGFFREQRGATFASSALMEPLTRAFVTALERFAQTEDVPLVTFKPGQRKDDVAQAHLGAFEGEEGVLFIGKAQEKAVVWRTERRRSAQTGQPYAWLVKSTALVNQYYIYAVDADADFGPFFLKFCSYFPYNAKLCLNGHEYLKRQLTKEGITFEALDNGLLSCADPRRMQEICDGLDAPRSAALLRQGLARLPHPFTAADRAAGFRYDLSILQAEFALTQVLDRPVSGRILCEEVIRENLDLGRPSQVHLIFDRRVTKRTARRFRTRVITQGVVPALSVDDKHSRIKHYHKEGRALRTETTSNDTRDVAIGKRLHNLPALRAVAFAANRRLLDVQQLSHDGLIGEETLAQVTRPQVVGGQRVSALPFADPRVQALLSVLVLYCLLPRGFATNDLRAHLAPLLLLGLEPSHLSPGRMTYDLRRLRLHGLIERIPHTQRYRVTPQGWRTALFFTRVYARLLRPGLARLAPTAPPGDAALRPYFDTLEGAIDRYMAQAQLAA